MEKTQYGEIFTNFPTIHDILRPLTLAQSLRKGRNAAICPSVNRW